jgi:DNA-binding GntR family transcriptional regulator
MPSPVAVYSDIALSGSLSERAYSLILQKILRGEIPLGYALSRRKLATEFNMSFLPISEAIQRLESEGFVESRPRVGTRVRVPTAQDVRDLYIIREALEVQSARLFCEKASSAERKEIRKISAHLDELSKKLESTPAEEELRFSVQTLHMNLHRRIAECTGCMPLCNMLEKNQVLIFNWIFDLAANSSLPRNWHKDLAKVLVGSDPDAASLAMGRHIRTGMEEIQHRIAERFSKNLGNLSQRPGSGEGEVPAAGSWRSRYSRSQASSD